VISVFVSSWGEGEKMLSPAVRTTSGHQSTRFSFNSSSTRLFRVLLGRGARAAGTSDPGPRRPLKRRKTQVCNTLGSPTFSQHPFNSSSTRLFRVLLGRGARAAGTSDPGPRRPLKRWKTVGRQKCVSSHTPSALGLHTVPEDGPSF
jgi:hypothetical protein